MSVGFDRLRAEVTESATIGASVVTLVNGLSDQIRLLANDPVALAALADELDATNALVAAAVAANTPAVPAPTVDDPVVVPSTDEGFTTV